MKYFLFVFLSLLLVSACGPTIKHIPRQVEVVGFDFTKYSEKGFLITPGEYGEDYETIGLLTFSVYPEANRENNPKAGPAASRFNWVIENINPSEAIEIAYQEAIKRGADAITHFEIDFDKRKYPGPGVYVTGVQVSGLLIKRNK